MPLWFCQLFFFFCRGGFWIITLERFNWLTSNFHQLSVIIFPGSVLFIGAIRHLHFCPLTFLWNRFPDDISCILRTRRRIDLKLSQVVSNNYPPKCFVLGPVRPSAVFRKWSFACIFVTVHHRAKRSSIWDSRPFLGSLVVIFWNCGRLPIFRFCRVDKTVLGRIWETVSRRAKRISMDGWMDLSISWIFGMPPRPIGLMSSFLITWWGQVYRQYTWCAPASTINMSMMSLPRYYVPTFYIIYNTMFINFVHDTCYFIILICHNCYLIFVSSLPLFHTEFCIQYVVKWTRNIIHVSCVL